MNRICIECGKVKPLTDFYTSNKYTINRCKHCYILQNRIYQNKHRDKIKKYNDDNKERKKQWLLNRKIEVLNHYTNNDIHCQCPCGCSHSGVEFMTIDHINGGGTQHRKDYHIGNIYKWLKDNNYPSGFRVLCFNCNCSHTHRSVFTI